MRFTLIAVGTLGDVRPFVALGSELVEAGHSVRLATHAAYADLARCHGLEHHLLPADPDELLASDSGQALVGSGRFSPGALRKLARLGDGYIDGVVAESTAASRDADLILGSPIALVVGAVHAGEKLGIPVAGAMLQPIHQTAEFASFLFPPWPLERVPGRASYNRLSYVALQHLVWQLVRRHVDRSRSRLLGLGPASRLGPSREIDRGDRLWLYGFSPTLLPKPRDWPPSAHVTGYWHLERGSDWQPPRLLEDFLGAGSPPVYVGFGSSGRYRQAETTALVLEGVRLSGQRGVVAVPGQEPSIRVISDDIIGIDGVPHDWLFPRTSLVVNPAGRGTVEYALRAGRPSVSVPHFLDQHLWARSLARLGASPRPISRRRLNASRLAEHIRAALADRGMAARAERLRGLVAAEHGSRRAVSAIEAHLGAA